MLIFLLIWNIDSDTSLKCALHAKLLKKTTARKIRTWSKQQDNPKEKPSILWCIAAELKMWHVFFFICYFITLNQYSVQFQCTSNTYWYITFYHMRLRHNNTFHLCLWQVERNIIICLKRKVCQHFQTTFCILYWKWLFKDFQTISNSKKRGFSYIKP